jgi:hypothetical protein
LAAGTRTLGRRLLGALGPRSDEDRATAPAKEESMPAKKTTPDDTATSLDQNGDGAALVTELAAATRALAQAVETLNATMAQLQQMRSPGAGLAALADGAQFKVNTWEDDPFSEVVPTTNPQVGAVITVDFHANANPQLQTAISESRPAPGLYMPGTSGFLYWCAEEALARGINLWTPLLPAGTTWSETANPVPVAVDRGEDLRARYMRGQGLEFYHITLRDIPIFSGESPDDVLHELGHAILDAVQPNLWDTLFFEVDAFHEAFGDISAILGSLQLRSMRDNVLNDTQGRLNANSRLSRVAERFGWGFRQRQPTRVDPDCLRNASNSFPYRKPEELQPTGPAHQLSQEPHSLCRIFTGAFLDALAAMFTRSGPASEANLLTASRDIGQLLIDAAINADYANPRYFRQVAAAMIQSDVARNGGKHRDDLKWAFQKRNILSPEDIAALAAAPVPAPVEVPQPAGAALAAAFGTAAGALGARTMLAFDDTYTDFARGPGETRELPKQVLTTSFGTELLVQAPTPARQFELAPAMANLAANGTPTAEAEARLFVDSLIQNGRVQCNVSRDLAPVLVDVVGETGSRKTHVVESDLNGNSVLRRIAFDCALGCDE